MQTMSSDTPATSGDDRQWQLKWGTPKPVQIGDVFEVRAFGQLEVGVRDPQRLADYVSAEDASVLSAAAQGRLKALVVPALQAALAQCDVAAFAADAGACPPGCVAQVTTAAAADLGAQLADLGFDLRAFVIMGCFYEWQRGAVSPIDGPVPGAVRMPPGLEVPFQSPAAGLGYAQGLGLKLQGILGLDPVQDKDDADA
ncbi:MAG TPA: SPFH domain-containing protein [Anaerolineae bacterium]|nr:SPFH domain-containing protein [Anaerolineae bacterium]